MKIQFSLPQQAAAGRSRRHRIQLINDELPPAFAGLIDFGTTHLSDSRPFREKVGEMLREVRRVFLDPQQTPRVRVIVSGRPSPDVFESKFLNDDTPVLTMRSIRPQQLREFVERLDDALGSVPPYVAVENPDAWRVPLTEELEKIKPEILKQQRLREGEWIREAQTREFWGGE